MRTGFGIVLPLLLGSSSVAAAAGEAWDFDTELEVGAFVHRLDDGQPDLLGQRLQVRARPWEGFTGQVDLTTLRRGKEDWGGQMAVAVWKDWTRHLFTVVNASGSQSAHDFFPKWRSELELHFKVPRLEGLVLFGGGGAAGFDDAGTWIGTGGTTFYFDRLGGGSASYRFIHMDNDFAGSSGRATQGRGNSHIWALSLSDEATAWGRFDLRYLFGQELLRNFSGSTSGENLDSHNVSVGWRRRWTRRFGTQLDFEWGRQKGVFDRRLGTEFRLVWYLGPQAGWSVRDRWSPGR